MVTPEFDIPYENNSPYQVHKKSFDILDAKLCKMFVYGVSQKLMSYTQKENTDEPELIMKYPHGS